MAAASASSGGPPDSGGDLEWQDIGERISDSKQGEIAAKWDRIVRKLRHIRRLQRYFGLPGQFLQGFGDDIPRDLRKTFKKQ